MKRFAIVLAVSLVACGSSSQGDPATSGGGGVGGEATSGAGGVAGDAGTAGSGGANGGGGGCPSAEAKDSLEVAYATITGVDPNLLRLDVYAPARAEACQLAPVVVWVHGGGWKVGDKTNKIPDKKALFLGMGYLLVSVNYRLSPNPENLSDPDRIMYPIHPTDVASALAWLRDHIAEYGGDPSNLALLGHSAGAGLVATVGTNETFLGAHGIGLDGLKCVGSFDTESYDIPRALQGDATQQVLYENAFGSDPSVWTEASPINHIVSDKGIPPFLIVKRGTLDRQQLEMDFGAALGTAGVWNQVIDATSLTHEQVNEHIGMAGDTVMTPPVMAFVQNQCFPGP